MMQQRLGAVLAAGAVGWAVGAQAQAPEQVPVFVNGGRLTSSARMLPNVARTVLPMRDLFQSLGATVEWDPLQRAVYAWKPDGMGVRLAVGDPNAQTLQMAAQRRPGNWGRVTGAYKLDAPALIAEGRVYVPLRFAAEALRADVRYSAVGPAVYVRVEPESGAGAGAEQVAGARQEAPRIDLNFQSQNLTRALEVTTELRSRRVSLRRDAAVPLRLVARNRSGRRLLVPMGGQRFDFQVFNSEGDRVWSWAQDKAFIMILEQRSLEPDEEMIFTARWDLRTNAGTRVPPGRYTVRGVLVTAQQQNGRFVNDVPLAVTD